MSGATDNLHEAASPAAEYALGVLSGADRRAVERRAESDQVLADEIAAWNVRLAPLYAAIPEAAPPPETLAAIEADIDRVARAARAAPSMAGRERRGVSIFWRWLALASSGLALVALAGLFLAAAGLLPVTNSGGIMMTATLAEENGRPLFAVVVDRTSQMATLVPIDHPSGDDRVPELWLIAGQGAQPRSLGVIDPSRPMQIRLDDMPERDAQNALAVSMEPQGGSPTGQPTGPVVASAPLTTI